MSLTPSNMLPLGTIAPPFSLIDTISNNTYTLTNLKGRNATVIAFICNHCPFVIHINPKLVEIANHYQEKGIHFIAISSNDATKYPQDTPGKMKIHAKENEYPFPYLYDETQMIAKKYDAACTPDFYIFDADVKLVYRGQMDNSRPGNEIAVTAINLTTALDALLANKPIKALQKPSIGCNIKWKN